MAKKEIFDPLRRRYVACTPEEEVRQRFVAWLVEALGYPPHLMANEVSLRLNDTLRRCDTVLFCADGRTPRMIIEYKAPDIQITQRVFNQITRYNMVLHAPYLAVTNGLHTFCLEVDYEAHTTHFLPSFPRYDALHR